ncbi:DUF4352 domain-containing protein [Streptomyces zaomyceticus]|uniref:DUF4352 domain-containing protein n=1 Tax=Streptomyces zaomyceticus TaxID=68286 RepID=UPI0036C60880
MRTRTATTALASALLLGLTACGTTPEPERPAAAPQATTTETTSASPTATPEATTATPMRLGVTHTWEDTDAGVSGTSVALSYQQGFKSAGSAAEETGTPGYVWAALELKVCSTKGTFAATTSPWTLAYADGARVEPSGSTWDDFPKPEFPVETTLTPGKCVRGKVVYPVPGGSRPETIVYAPGSMTPVEWAAPAK